MESRAARMFWNDPRMWILVSASTMRVRVAFSIVNLVLPFLPARGRGRGGARCSGRAGARAQAAVRAALDGCGLLHAWHRDAATARSCG